MQYGTLPILVSTKTCVDACSQQEGEEIALDQGHTQHPDTTAHMRIDFASYCVRIHDEG